MRRYVTVIVATFVSALALYLAVGVCGYLAFGSYTSGDVLENFGDSYPLAVGARGALLVVLASCYPKVQHSVRDGLLRLLYADRGYTTDNAPRGTLYMLTLGVVGTTTLLGTLCSAVEVVLAYKGAIFGSLMVYVWPALMHAALRIQAAKRPGAATTPPSSWTPSLTTRLVLPAEALEGGCRHPPPPPPPLPPAVVGVGTLPAEAPTALLSGGGVDERFGEDGECAGREASRAAAPPGSLGQTAAAMLSSRAHVGSALLLAWGVVSGVLGVGVTIDKQWRGGS